MRCSKEKLQEIHRQFMVAAMNGLVASVKAKQKLHVNGTAISARDIADACFGEYMRRWKEEDEWSALTPDGRCRGCGSVECMTPQVTTHLPPPNQGEQITKGG